MARARASSRVAECAARDPHPSAIRRWARSRIQRQDADAGTDRSARRVVLVAPEDLANASGLNFSGRAITDVNRALFDSPPTTVDDVSCCGTSCSTCSRFRLRTDAWPLAPTERSFERPREEGPGTCRKQRSGSRRRSGVEERARSGAWGAPRDAREWGNAQRPSERSVIVPNNAGDSGTNGPSRPVMDG